MGVAQNLDFKPGVRHDLLALQAQVRSLTPAVSPPMRRILQFIADSPGAVGGLEARELAEATQSSPATVVRTARRLGYRGYRELRMALTAMTAVARRGGERVLGDITAADPPGEMMTKLARDEQDTLHATALTANPAAVDEVAHRIVAARRVHVFGIVFSGLVAADLANKLARIGIFALPHVEAHEALTTAVLTGPEDLAMGISSSGRTADVVEPLASAARQGATTVAVTADADSPLAQACDHLLLSVVGPESEVRATTLSSRISQLYLVDAVFIRVMQLTYDRSADLMHATHEAVHGRRTAPLRSARGTARTTSTSTAPHRSRRRKS